MGAGCWGFASASPRPVTEAAPLSGNLQPSPQEVVKGRRDRRASFLGWEVGRPADGAGF